MLRVSMWGGRLRNVRRTLARSLTRTLTLAATPSLTQRVASSHLLELKGYG